MAKAKLKDIRHSCMLAMMAVLMAAGTTSAAEQDGCSALADGKISLGAQSPNHLTGAVPLSAGTTVRLQANIADAAQATATQARISVVENGTVEPALITGQPPLTTQFTVPYDGLFGFSFQTSGETPVTFHIDCDRQTAADQPAFARPESYNKRRAGRILGQHSQQTNLRRRYNKPANLNQAIKRQARIGENGAPAEVSVVTSIQDIAAAQGQTFAGKKLDLWVEGRVSQFDQRFNDNGQRVEAKANTGILQVGTDYLIRPGLMIGTLLQIDQYRENFGDFANNIDGSGILFGPYASIDLGSGLMFDARAAWGSSNNDIALPDGTQLGFATKRQLIRGELSGSRNLYGLQFTPRVAVSVVEDRITGGDEGALDEGNDAGSATMGQFGLGSTLSYRHALEDGGFIQPSAGLSSSWNLDQLEDFSLEGTNFTNERGAKAEAGVTLGTTDGVSISASGAIEGIGEEDYSAWSGRLSLTAPLN